MSKLPVGRGGVKAEPNRAPTDKQMEILELMRQGLINRDIAMALDISDRTVSTTIRRAYKKYGIEPHMNAYHFISTLIKLGVIKEREEDKNG